jgi:hypothetical protein
MPRSRMRQTRTHFGTMLAALLLLVPWMPAGADEVTDFRAALDTAASQYRLAMDTLETRGREETAAEVRRFRQSWQAIAERFGAAPPLPVTKGDDYPGLFLQTDMSIVGALIVIDIGSREAARNALAPIADTLVALSARAAVPR